MNSTVACPRAAGGTNPLGAELRDKISTRGGRERQKEDQFVKQTVTRVKFLPTTGVEGGFERGNREIDHHPLTHRPTAARLTPELLLRFRHELGWVSTQKNT